MTTDQGSPPTVTVVMPAFNSERTLRDSARSVLDQSFSALELVIVDDSSADRTAAIATELGAGDARVRLIRNPHSLGPAGARNAAISAARGRYVAFCDSDDLWLPSKLERQLEVATQTGAALVYSGYHRVDADFSGPASGFRPADRVVHVPTLLTHGALLHRNVVGCLTAMIDTEQTGPVSMPGIPGAEDWALWLRVLREGGTAAGIDEPLALYRTAQPGSHSARRWRAVLAVWRVLRSEEGLSVPRAAFHVVTDAIAALRKQQI
ncbi:glycosyl transferase family 2 [Xylanimonas cellulosilytica DSM 15894]|uniref:Glycosyl transferase family 2 n=1 Tax=Xylanimonas cellulosilytica (strain DSM 15894 / JCM 12276 / CECT 5975 / KCTC 9989 / LMG 20990 / NBRC 107835 / XIL07) TaxID=446471 RepID=D1BX31_XYLCX|nr:glycosyltransferase family 2 protein [Xylanimonas cellulosilytica]ACZ31599.1 glycosyl transferase family 2 [Xylanimonas cellulosilytica DSM 15894]